MPACVRCGREIPPVPTGELNICPECRATILARQSQNPAPPRRRSRGFQDMPITSVLIGLNALVFVLMTASGVSFTSPTPQQLLKWGADFGPYALTGQPWRLLTCTYVHIGILHIALNMWCLWNLRSAGGEDFRPLDLRSNLHSLRNRKQYCGGMVASNAGDGGSVGRDFRNCRALITALYLGRLPVPPSAIKATLKSLLAFAGYNLFFGLLPGISNAAHLGGLVTGLGLGAVLAPRLTAPPDERNSWRRLVFISAAVLLTAFFYFVKRSLLHAALTPPGQ